MTVIPVVCITHFLSTPTLQITLSCSQKHSIETHVMINTNVLSGNANIRQREEEMLTFQNGKSSASSM